MPKYKITHITQRILQLLLDLLHGPIRLFTLIDLQKKKFNHYFVVAVSKMRLAGIFDIHIKLQERFLKAKTAQ